MSSLNTLKNGGKLRKYFSEHNLKSIRPEKRNRTRWESCKKMVEKMIKLHPHLSQCGFEVATMALIPHAVEIERLKALLKVLG